MNSKPILEDNELEFIENLLSKGADERILINDDGNTKYSIPLLHDNIVNRGSCTCSVATRDELGCITKVLEETSSENDWIDQIDNISNRLKAVLNEEGKDNLELFFAPSGTDLVYYPLMLSNLTNPNRKILTITTCIEELGSGTRLAATARYYANYNQFGEEIKLGEKILSSIDVSSRFFKARSESGEILNNHDEILALIKEHEDHIIIINLVYGSKSGIEDSIGLIDKIKGDNIFWNIDFCQFRHSNTIINKLIEKKSTIMITGSKFYQTPPFCAALIVSKDLYRQILNVSTVEWNKVKPFESIFSAYDFPKAIRHKTNFRKKVNPSVILRWLCALNEIEMYNAIPEDKTEEKINDWRDTVVEHLEKNESFEIMPFQEDTNKTIVSFRVKKEGRFLNHEELKELHKYTVLSDYSFLPEESKLFIGQPVTYHDNKSFLRLAIGSKNIRKFIENDEQHFKMDKQIIDALKDNIGKYDEVN